MLPASFFARDSQELAIALLGKVLRRKYRGVWLSAMITETEAYYRHDKASHAYRGETPRNRAMFMPPGTIYMYHARGTLDSLNISVLGEGNAVLIKSALPYFDKNSPEKTTLPLMQKLNPLPGGRVRSVDKLCAGQALLCRSLALKVKNWNTRSFDRKEFYIEDVGLKIESYTRNPRRGIHPDKDAHLLYRFTSE